MNTNKSLAALDLLFALYSIHSPSGGERPMLQFIEKELEDLGIHYEKDREGQIWHVTENMPLLCVHTDQVQKSAPARESIALINGEISAKGFGLGADDKNGIWVVLQILRHAIAKKQRIPSFIFSVEEERISGKASKCFKEHFLKSNGTSKVPFAIVLDRRNGGDIIGRANGYCSQKFEEEITKLGERFGYRPTMGLYSDADGLSAFVNAVNLSVGYYNPHTTDEYTVYEELLNALDFTRTLLDPVNVEALAAQPFEKERVDLRWGRRRKARSIYDTYDTYSPRDAWSRGFGDLWVTDVEKDYIEGLLLDRLGKVELELQEYWEGNVEDDPDNVARLEEEYLTIENILGAM